LAYRPQAIKTIKMKLTTSDKTRLKATYGPWALVTGASSGIGLEIAERLAEAGLNLVLNARRKDLLDKIADNLRSQYKIEVAVIAADASLQTGNELIIKTSKQFDIGLLVASAGYGTSGEFYKADIDEETNMLHLNCESPLVLTHHFSKKFVGRGKGGIILLSSMVAFQGVPYSANYAATKAYIQILAEGIHSELKPYGVDVLAVAPGPVKSGFEGRAGMQMDMALKPADIGVPILRALGRKTTVLPGALTKLLVYSLRTVPKWAKIRIMKLVMGNMTQHQRA